MCYRSKNPQQSGNAKEEEAAIDEIPPAENL